MPRILQGLQVTCHRLATSRLAQLSLSPNSSSTTIFSLTPPRALQVNTTPISLLAQQQNPIRTADTIKNSQCEMSERGHQRGGRGGGRGEHRGGRGGGGRGAHAGGERERPKKENILDLGKYMDKKITVKFTGGREVTGTLKGYDALMNLVLDDVDEILRDDEGNTSTRALGLVVARGTLLVLVSPVDGSEEIANPFVQAEE